MVGVDEGRIVGWDGKIIKDMKMGGGDDEGMR